MMKWTACRGSQTVDDHWIAQGQVSVEKFRKIFRRLPYGVAYEDYEWDECGISMQGVFIPWRKM